MFLQAIRQHIDSIPVEATGWLSGLRDRHVGFALGLMHSRTSERWTIDGLAREVGLSRSAFAERFSQLIGMPPMQYLGNWRLQLAAQLLDRNGISVAGGGACRRLRVGGGVQPRLQEKGRQSRRIVASLTIMRVATEYRGREYVAIIHQYVRKRSAVRTSGGGRANNRMTAQAASATQVRRRCFRKSLQCAHAYAPCNSRAVGAISAAHCATCRGTLPTFERTAEPSRDWVGLEA